MARADPGVSRRSRSSRSRTRRCSDGATHRARGHATRRRTRRALCSPLTTAGLARWRLPHRSPSFSPEESSLLVDVASSFIPPEAVPATSVRPRPRPPASTQGRRRGRESPPSQRQATSSSRGSSDLIRDGRTIAFDTTVRSRIVRLQGRRGQAQRSARLNPSGHRRTPTPCRDASWPRPRRGWPR